MKTFQRRNGSAALQGPGGKMIGSIPASNAPSLSVSMEAPTVPTFDTDDMWETMLAKPDNGSDGFRPAAAWNACLASAVEYFDSDRNEISFRKVEDLLPLFNRGDVVTVDNWGARARGYAEKLAEVDYEEVETPLAGMAEAIQNGTEYQEPPHISPEARLMAASWLGPADAVHVCSYGNSFYNGRHRVLAMAKFNPGAIVPVVVTRGD